MKNTNRLSNIALVIGLTLSLVAIINGFAVTGFAAIEDDIRAKYMYRYLNTIGIYDEECEMENYEALFSSLGNSDSNRGLLLQVYIGENEVDMLDNTVLYIYYDCRIPVLYKMMEGNLPDGTEGEPAVAVGCENERYVYKKGGKKYICINGTECLVTGIYGDYGVEYSSGGLYSTTDSLGETAQKSIMHDCIKSDFDLLGIEVFEETDEEKSVLSSIDEKYIYVYGESKFGINEYSLGTIDRSVDTELQREENKMYQMLFTFLALFAIVGSFALSGLWLNAHKKEIAIRKLWGYSTGQLFGVLFKKLGILGILSLLLAFIIQIPITISWRGSFDVFGYLNRIQVLEVIGVIAVIILLMSGLEIIKSKKITPADALRKYEY